MRKQAKGFPGGVIGGVPRLNAANVRHVLRGNAVLPREVICPTCQGNDYLSSDLQGREYDTPMRCPNPACPGWQVPA